MDPSWLDPTLAKLLHPLATTFLVNDGIESALLQAREATGDRGVVFPIALANEKPQL
ncbi:MAG: hypothetical protein J2P19_30255 [Pseudonocardia sp.]|nr:hypothetical protein [Pseudonocardia sp.]